MSHLVLIRHSISHQQPDVPTHDWTLTSEGIARCSLLVEHLRPYSPVIIYSSTEKKACLTASSLAEHLMSPVNVSSVEGLEETHRKTAPYYKNVGDFQAAVVDAIHHPDEILFGEESFTEARQRLDQTLHDLMNKHPNETVAAVSHGTILSLWLAPLIQRPIEDIWQAMNMPAYAIIEWPSKRVIHFQETLV